VQKFMYFVCVREFVFLKIALRDISVCVCVCVCVYLKWMMIQLFVILKITS
jgi:hypothetical protein